MELVKYTADRFEIDSLISRLIALKNRRTDIKAVLIIRNDDGTSGGSVHVQKRDEFGGFRLIRPKI